MREWDKYTLSIERQHIQVQGQFFFVSFWFVYNSFEYFYSFFWFFCYTKKKCEQLTNFWWNGNFKITPVEQLFTKLNKLIKLENHLLLLPKQFNQFISFLGSLGFNLYLFWIKIYVKMTKNSKLFLIFNKKNIFYVIFITFDKMPHLIVFFFFFLSMHCSKSDKVQINSVVSWFRWPLLVKVMHAIFELFTFRISRVKMTAFLTFQILVIVVFFLLFIGSIIHHFDFTVSLIRNHLVIAITTIRTGCRFFSCFSSVVSKLMKIRIQKWKLSMSIIFLKYIQTGMINVFFMKLFT